MSIENDVRLIGNCCADPETAFTGSGTAVTKVRIATTRKFKKDGQPQEETQFHSVKFFGRLAELAGEYLRKGSQVTIAGSIRYTQSERDGTTRYYTDIIAEHMKFHGAPAGERSGGTSRPARSEPRRDPPNKSDAFGEDFVDDSDIPFITHRGRF